MIRTWWPALAASGFIRADFAAALAALLVIDRQSAPKWDREHWSLVMRYLRPAMEARTRKPRAPGHDADAPYCRTCERGLVSVPLRDDLRDGTWRPPYRRGDVACLDCHTGRQRHAGNQKLAADKAITGEQMTLETYEKTVCKHWRDLVAERAEAERLMRVAARETECLTTFCNLAKRLASGFKMPPRTR